MGNRQNQRPSRRVCVGDINLNTVCVTAVDADYTIVPVCQASGPSNNRSKKKVMLKFDRQELIGAIPDVTGTVDLTVIGTVGEAGAPVLCDRYNQNQRRLK